MGLLSSLIGDIAYAIGYEHGKRKAKKRALKKGASSHSTSNSQNDYNDSYSGPSINYDVIRYEVKNGIVRYLPGHVQENVYIEIVGSTIYVSGHIMLSYASDYSILSDRLYQGIRNGLERASNRSDVSFIDNADFSRLEISALNQ